MAREIAAQFEMGFTDIIKSVKNEYNARQVYTALGGASSDVAIYFFEQWRYYSYTGQIMVA